MESPLFKAHAVEAIYVNFDSSVCIQITPDESYYESEDKFVQRMTNLLQRREGAVSEGERVMMQTLTDRSAMLGQLPGNAYFIECLSGPEGTYPTLKDHLENIDANQSVMMVEGRLNEQAVTTYINNNIVKVSSQQVVDYTLVRRFIEEMELKMNIY